MSGYQVVDPRSLPAGKGPHSDASKFGRRVSQALGVTAFAASQIELPPGDSTVSHHHADDQVEEVYVILDGAGWVVVNGDECAVAAEEWIAVDMDAERYVRAGERGMRFIAVGAPRCLHDISAPARRPSLRGRLRRMRLGGRHPQRSGLRHDLGGPPPVGVLQSRPSFSSTACAGCSPREIIRSKARIAAATSTEPRKIARMVSTVGLSIG